MRDVLPVGRDVLAHCQVSQDAVPHPAAIRDADNTPQGSSAGVGYCRYKSRPHGVYSRRFRAYRQVLAARQCCTARGRTLYFPGLSEGLRLYMTCLGHYYLMLM